MKDNNNTDYQKWIAAGGLAIIFIVVVIFRTPVKSIVLGFLRIDFQDIQTPISEPTDQIYFPVNNDCKKAYGGRLSQGDTAEIVVFQVAVRERPGGPDGRQYLNVLADGQRIQILEGSTCVNGSYYVRIQSPIIDQIGWVAEGNNEQYYLIPVH